MLSLLFRNVSRKQAILKNTFWLSLAIGLAGFGDFLVTVYVIRRFGATEYGKFAYALSFVSLFSALFDFGLATAATREFASNRDRERVFSDLLTLKALIGAAGVAVVMIGGFVVSRDVVTRQMIIILGLYVLFVELANLFYALFRSRQQMELEALFRTVYIVSLVTLIVLAMAVRPTIVSVGLAYLGAAMVTVSANLMMILRADAARLALRPSADVRVWQEFLRIGLYIALVKVSSDVMTNVGSVILGYLGRVTEIGWYNAANKVNGLVLFPMSLVASAIFPALADLRDRSPGQFVRYWIGWARYTVTLAVLLSFLIFVRAADIVALLYRENFHPAATTLQILAVAAILVYIQSLYYQVLLIFNRQREIFLAVLNAGVVNLILNFLLVPRLGIYGLAAVVVATQFLLLCQYLVLTGRHTPVKPVPLPVLLTLVISLISGLVMGAVVSFIPQGRTGILLALPAGVLVYSASVAAFTQMSKRFSLHAYAFGGKTGSE